MSDVLDGRYTADDDEVTVFLIGMRINTWSRPQDWMPVAAAMPRMLTYLNQHRDRGMLACHSWTGRTTILLSYWRTPEDLSRFASDPDADHLLPWRRYNTTLSKRGSVGIWHETYVTRAADRESIYANMPAFGLGKAVGLRQVGPGSNTARQRLAGGR